MFPVNRSAAYMVSVSYLTTAEDTVSHALRWVSIVQELCESRGGRPGLSVLTSFSGFRGRKELLNHASALVTTCP